MRLHRESGQAMTEYLMISGLITVIAIIVLREMFPNLQATLQELAGCVINERCGQG